MTYSVRIRIQDAGWWARTDPLDRWIPLRNKGVIRTHDPLIMRWICCPCTTAPTRYTEYISVGTNWTTISKPENTWFPIDLKPLGSASGTRWDDEAFKAKIEWENMSREISISRKKLTAKPGIIWQSSATRWLDYLFNIGPFTAMNIWSNTIKMAKVGSQKLPNILKCSPKWRNFAKSGHTAWHVYRSLLLCQFYMPNHA